MARTQRVPPALLIQGSCFLSQGLVTTCCKARTKLTPVNAGLSSSAPGCLGLTPLCLQCSFQGNIVSYNPKHCMPSADYSKFHDAALNPGKSVIFLCSTGFKYFCPALMNEVFLFGSLLGCCHRTYLADALALLYSVEGVQILHVVTGKAFGSWISHKHFKITARGLSEVPRREKGARSRGSLTDPKITFPAQTCTGVLFHQQFCPYSQHKHFCKCTEGDESLTGTDAHKRSLLVHRVPLPEIKAIGERQVQRTESTATASCWNKRQRGAGTAPGALPAENTLGLTSWEGSAHSPNLLAIIWWISRWRSFFRTLS